MYESPIIHDMYYSIFIQEVRMSLFVKRTNSWQSLLVHGFDLNKQPVIHGAHYIFLT